MSVSDHTIMNIWIMKIIFLYNSSVYSCYLFLIFSASVWPLLFLSFIEPIFAWNVTLVCLISLKRSLVFPILFFSSISLHSSLRKAFLSFLAVLWNSACRWVYLSFSPLPFTWCQDAAYLLMEGLSPTPCSVTNESVSLPKTLLCLLQCDQHLHQCPAHSTCLVNICWVNKRSNDEQWLRTLEGERLWFESCFSYFWMWLTQIFYSGSFRSWSFIVHWEDQYLLWFGA